MVALTIYCISRLGDGISYRYGPRCACFVIAIMPIFFGVVPLSEDCMTLCLILLCWGHYFMEADNRVALLAGLCLLFPHVFPNLIIPLCFSLKSTIVAKDGSSLPSDKVSLIKKFELFYRKMGIALLFWLVYIFIPMVLVDRYYYGRWVISTLNRVIIYLFYRPKAMSDLSGLHLRLMIYAAIVGVLCCLSSRHARGSVSHLLAPLFAPLRKQ